MILVLQGADFSANNLGQVEVKRVINPFTLAAIDASGNQSMTNEQKSALDTFFETIGAFGSANSIWSKLDKVYIPFLCSSLSKACVNYKTNVIDRSLSETRYALRNRGVTGATESPAGYTEPKLNEDIAIDPKDLSVLAILMEQDVSLTGINPLVAYEGNSGSNRWSVSLSKSGNGNGLVSLTGIKPSGSLDHLVGNSFPIPYKLMGINIRAVNDIVYCQESSLFHSTNASSFLESVGEDTPAKSLGIFTDSASRAISSSAPSIGMVLLGKGLTDAELIELKSASESLVEFFKL